MQMTVEQFLRAARWVTFGTTLLGVALIAIALALVIGVFWPEKTDRESMVRTWEELMREDGDEDEE